MLKWSVYLAHYVVCPKQDASLSSVSLCFLATYHRSVFLLARDVYFLVLYTRYIFVIFK